MGAATTSPSPSPKPPKTPPPNQQHTEKKSNNGNKVEPNKKENSPLPIVTETKPPPPRLKKRFTLGGGGGGLLDGLDSDDTDQDNDSIDEKKENELSQTYKLFSQELLQSHHNINIAQIDSLLQLIDSENSNHQMLNIDGNKNMSQLLSFFVDAFHLMQCDQICNNETELQTIEDFIRKYAIHKHKNLSEMDNRISDDFFKKTYEKYRAFIGIEPLNKATQVRYKIEDNLSIFMSYTFGMNAAIKQYIKPEPPISPLIIDLWIVPNKVRDTNHNNDNQMIVHNKIGNINIRLRQNKTIFIHRKCVPNNIRKFTQQIMDCLADKKIRDGMNHKSLKRIIFIVDRRYKKSFDKLYCVLPPTEYGQISESKSFDILNINHWYCTSQYLLPHTSRYDDNGSHTHIGACSDLKGYMFNLSYLIFPNPFQEEHDNTEQEIIKSETNIQNHLSPNRALDTITEYKNEEIKEQKYDNGGGYAGFGVHKTAIIHGNDTNCISPRESVTSPAEHFSQEIIENKSDKSDNESVEDTESSKGSDVRPPFQLNKMVSLFDDSEDNNDTIQWSTANVKMLFSTQQMIVRFKPSHMIKLWKRYFITDEKQLILSEENPKNLLKDIVSHLFELNLYDPYFVEMINEFKNMSQDLRFKYSMQPNARINAYDILNGYSDKWVKQGSQTETDKKQSKANVQLQLLHKCMPNENIEYKSQYLPAVDYNSRDILIESGYYGRPKLKINYHSIYDCIIWKTQGNIGKSMEEYVENELKLTDIISEEKQSLIVSEEILSYDKAYNGSQFIANNESLLINDAIVSYAYYLCVISHILRSLMQSQTHKHCPFQFTVTFITRSVVSTSGKTPKRAHVCERLKDIHKRFKFSDYYRKLSLTEDIKAMGEFLSEFYCNKSLKNKRINLIFDRRKSTMHSNECECYAHCTDFDNEDVIIKMNVTPTIPRLKAKDQSNPNLFHINFYNFCDDQIMAYFIRKESCIRFFPELMMDVWPKIFFGDPKSLLDIVYKNKFRHSFAVGLNDKDFTQNYYALFNRKFVSINYYRPRIDLQRQNQRSASVTVSSNDVPPMFLRAKSQKFHSFKTRKCVLNNQALQKLMKSKSGNDNQIKIDCPIIEKIAFLMSYQNSPTDIDTLIEIFRENEYTVTNLMDDVVHLLDEHKLESDISAHTIIKKYITDYSPEIKDCTNSDCHAMQRHCRKSLIRISETTETNASEGSEIYKHKNEEIKTWISQFDKIHCCLFHLDKDKTFRFRYGRKFKSKRKLNIADTIDEDTIEDINVYANDGTFEKLKFGVCVDEWLLNGVSPEFKTIEEEVLHNHYEPIESEILTQIKFEVQSRYFSVRSNRQHLNVEEILSLKLFTDLDTLQKEFTKAFWNETGPAITNRRRQFYHWANALKRAFKYGNVPIRQKLYRGYDKVLQLPSFNPFCGQPTSTTTDPRVADQFAADKGIIVSSNTNEIVFGMDVSWFSRFHNEKEIWIYDQIFPIQQAMVSLSNENVKINYIQAHLIEIDHQIIGNIRQFLHFNDQSKAKIEEYIHKMRNNTDLLKKVTKYEGLNVFERLFFEWHRYSLTIPTMTDVHTPLDSFEALIGEYVYLNFRDGYFYITGIKAVIIETFNPTVFRIEYNDHELTDNKYWHKYIVSRARLDSNSKILIPIRNQQINYRFVAEFFSDSIYENEEEKTHIIPNKKVLISDIHTLKLSMQNVIEIENRIQKSKVEIKYDYCETSDSETDDRGPLSIIDKIDLGLGKYYHQHGRDDYYNESGEGLFKLYCEDNGFDDDEVEGQMNEEPDECMLIEMDEEDFPFKKPPKDWDSAVFGVIKRCYEDEDAFTYELKYEIFEVTAEHYNIRRECNEVRFVIETHKRQTPRIFRKGFAEDRSITKLLAVSKRMKQPYLQLLADMYGRDRFKFRKLNIEQWAKQNKHMLHLKQFDLPNQSAYTDVQSALKSWYHILSPILMLNSQTKIVDSVQKCCEYICHSVDFVYNFTSKNEDLLPFQYDYGIVFPKVVSDPGTYTKLYVEDDDEESDSDSEEEERRRRDENSFIDCVGDIRAKLRSNQCIFASSIIDNSNENNNDSQFQLSQTKITSNVKLNVRFNKFKRDKLAQKYTGYDLNEYPKRKRFCTLIDRRHKNGNMNDKCVFYEPPNNCNSFPNVGDDYTQLCYFDRTITSLLPCLDYNEGKDEYLRLQTHMSTKEKLLAQNITGNTHCKGALMTFSFHVESLKEIKCYIYLNGQFSRFFPCDILDIIPPYFNNSDENTAFAKSKEIKQMVKYMTPKLRDFRFETFYKQNT